MPVFLYTARDRAGQTTSGSLEAETDSRAAARLREQGLWVTELRLAAALPGARTGQRNGQRNGWTDQTETSFAKRLRSPVSLKDLALYYRQLHTMLNSGMPLYQSLATLGGGNQTPNPHLRRVVGELAQNIMVGERLSGAMARFPWLFDRMQVRMVEAGEAGGLLVEIVRRLAEYLEREFELQLEIKRKTLYPKILLFALIFIPPVPTLVLAGPGAYALEIWTILQYLVLIGIPLWFVARTVLTTKGGRELWDQVKLSLPITGPLVRKIVASRFARTLAALYGAGVPIATAVNLSGEASGNSVLESAAARMQMALERGVSISQALGSSQFFPPIFLGMVSTGEATGNLDEMLDKAADFYEQEALHATIQLVVIMGVLLLLAMAILIAIKIIKFWTGFYSGVSNLGGAGGGAGGGGGGSDPGGAPGE